VNFLGPVQSSKQPGNSKSNNNNKIAANIIVTKDFLSRVLNCHQLSFFTYYTILEIHLVWKILTYYYWPAIVATWFLKFFLNIIFFVSISSYQEAQLLAVLCSPSSKNPTSISYIIFHLEERETTKLTAYGSAPLGKFNSALVGKNVKCSMKFPEEMK
jgi:hypothetical protein